MREILIVPDVHGRTFWKPVLDYPGQIIFLGDYLDPYPDEGIGEDTAFGNFLDIVDFKTDNPERVTLLVGNHELSYLDPVFNHSRRSDVYYDCANDILTSFDFQVCKRVGTYLFSHAGVGFGWYKKHRAELLKRGTTIEQQLNTYFQDSKMAFDETGSIRGGAQEFGSPLWADLSELWYEETHFDPNIFQIVGHSKQEAFNLHIACLDNRQLYLLRDDVIVPFEKQQCKMISEKQKLIPVLGERDFEFTRYFYVLSDGIIPCKLNDRRTYSRDVVEALKAHYNAHPLFSHNFAQALEAGDSTPYIRQHMLTLSNRMVVRCLESKNATNFWLSLYYDGDQIALQEYMGVIEPFVVPLLR